MHRSSIDEHTIEITLPKTVSLGHVDLRFTMYQQTANPPAVQVTLLKQQTNGLGYRCKSKTAAKPPVVAVDPATAKTTSTAAAGGSARCRVNAGDRKSSERTSGDRKITDSMEFIIDWKEASGMMNISQKCAIRFSSFQTPPPPHATHRQATTCCARTFSFRATRTLYPDRTT